MVVIHGIGPEKEVICTRATQVGDVLSIGMVSAEYVIESATALIRELKNSGSGSGLLMFSCLLRAILLGGSHEKEIELLQKELEGFPGPCLFLSSAGEICPRYTETGGTLNQIYSYALIACRF
jgi:small ligand-binding sensory domain FIST